MVVVESLVSFVYVVVFGRYATKTWVVYFASANLEMQKIVGRTVYGGRVHA